MSRECAVEDCGGNTRTKSATYCEKHYYRLRRNGTLETVQARVPDRACVAPGCDERAFHVDGHCRNCRLRLKRNGDYANHNFGPLSSHWRAGDEMTWSAIHQRVRKARGNAKNYSCVDCGGGAAHWSYNHRDPNERIDHHQGYELPVGTAIEFYEPRCVSCHKKFDLARIEEAPWTR